MMGSRSGSADPGILIPDASEGLHCRPVGSGAEPRLWFKGNLRVSADMQIVAAIAQDNSNCFAQDMYVHRLRSCIGAMLASSGGLDTLCLTAGVGENSALVRTAACEAFGF